MKIYFFDGGARMPRFTATKSSPLSQAIAPWALVSLFMIFSLSASVSAQQAQEPENDSSATQESGETQNAPQTSTVPRNSRGVIELESQVTGNQEQPQVFYVVPWQSPESPQLPYDPLGSQLEEVFGHLEREELRRELKQRDLLQTEADSETTENPYR